MRSRFFQLPAHVKPATRLVIACTGFVLVHIAAYLLHTAIAPYLGSVLGILGLSLFFLGTRRSARRVKKSAGRKYYYLKA